MPLLSSSRVCSDAGATMAASACAKSTPDRAAQNLRRPGLVSRVRSSPPSSGGCIVRLVRLASRHTSDGTPTVLTVSTNSAGSAPAARSEIRPRLVTQILRVRPQC